MMIRNTLAALALYAIGCGVATAADTDMFPPPQPVESPIRGAIDFHVHSGPDVFGRSIDDMAIARLAAEQGMRALVLKNHVTSTADRAAIVMKVVPGIEVFGGVTLNNAVGGLNPNAVEWMLRMSGQRGKVVWLPTFDSDNHRRVFGSPGEGIRVAVDGTVTLDMEAVLQVIAREQLVLQTGHVSADEVLAVVDRAHALGIENIIVTHAMADVPGLTIAQMTKVAELGGVLELVFLNHLMGPQAQLAWMRHWSQVSIAAMAKAISAVGAEHFILASDLGQIGTPLHTDGYRLLAAGLRDAGISDQEIDLMMRRTPARLLGLDG
jgi:hypothetical protein